MTPRFRPVRVGNSVSEAVPALLDSLRASHAGAQPVAVIVGLLVRDASAGRTQPRFRWCWQLCQVGNLAESRARILADGAEALRRISVAESDA
jgi:hypothetical protein